MYYKHDLNLQYPDRCDAHMIDPPRVRELQLDATYSYLPKGFGYKLLRGVYWLLVNAIVFPLMRLTHGLRIEGKKNLKAHKKALKGGAITVSNHVFMWDYLCVLKAIRPHLAYFPAWRRNLESGFRHMVRLSGGIPVPEESLHEMARFNRAMGEALEAGKWIHFFPEGSLWFFYPDIRPLKKAVFHYAVRYNKPVVPITMSFRPRRGLLRLFGKGPAVDLHVGTPLFANETLPRAEAAEQLRAATYRAMQAMNGIREGDPTYNEDQDPTHYQKSM